MAQTATISSLIDEWRRVFGTHGIPGFGFYPLETPSGIEAIEKSIRQRDEKPLIDWMHEFHRTLPKGAML